jgi:SsrA-binding protein
MPRRGDKVAISNRRARHDYHILDSYECGIVLVGSEVKSIRDGRANLQDAYARIEGGEVWLHGMHVSPYPFAREQHDPTRRRKLLLHHDQIDRLLGKTSEAGVTLVPLKIYFKDGLAKVDLALARGKRQWDKRQAIAKRDAARETERALKSRRREG